ncbi:MAG: hypothetical protein OIF47_06160 [Marinibacterium sp.]|nr:hypothetical protein [Marinibacterium sp.]
MKPQMIAGLALAALTSAGASGADTWHSDEGGRGASSYVEKGRFQLMISCWPGNPEFFFTLYGGPFDGMKNIDDQTDSMMMWIELPDGRTGRHPIDGHYFAPDQAFVGRFIVNDYVLEQFRQGAKLFFTAPTGADIVSFGMTGTGKARGHFKQACGI